MRGDQPTCTEPRLSLTYPVRRTDVANGVDVALQLVCNKN